MRAASEVEAEYYGEINRIQEIILFSQKMGYKKLGIAFCAALSEEAAKLSQILENYFEISTVNCKVCGVEKSRAVPLSGVIVAPSVKVNCGAN